MKTQLLNSSEGDKKLQDNELDQIILKVLKQYNQWAFSALRIKNWGASQSGFKKLQNYETQELRESLRRLLSKNKVKKLQLRFKFLVLEMVKQEKKLLRIQNWR